MLLSVKPRFGSHLSKLSVCESPGADVSRHNEAKLTFVTMLASQNRHPKSPTVTRSDIQQKRLITFPLADWPEVQYGWSRQNR